MTNLKNDKEKIQFALDLANLDLKSSNLRVGDLLNLKESLTAFGGALPDADFKAKVIPSIRSSFQSEQDKVFEALKELLKKIQLKVSGFLDSLAAENFSASMSDKQIQAWVDTFIQPQFKNDKSRIARIPERVPLEAGIVQSGIRDSSKETELVIKVRGNAITDGSPEDVFIFQLLILLSRFPGGILKCPQCGKYFLKRGMKRFCAPRCQVNWANKKYYRNKQAKEEVLELHNRERLSAKTIVKRLKHIHGLDESMVRSWIGESATVQRKKTKRRK